MRFFCLSLFVFITTAALAQDSVKLSGSILNPESDSVEISYNDNLIAYYPKEFYTVIDKKGHFSFIIPVPHGRYVQVAILHGRRSAELLLQPGDSMVMTADADRFDSTVHFTGRGGDAANFMAKHTLVKGRMNQYTIKIKTDINKGPSDFLRNIELERKAEMDFLNKNKTGLSASFVRYWTAFYQYYNYFFIQQYPQIHEIIKLRRYTDTVPPANYVVVKDMPYSFNDSLLQVPSYLLYLTGAPEIRMKAAGYVYLGADQEQGNKIQDSVNSLAYKMLPAGSAEYFIAQGIYGRVRMQDPERTRAQYKVFKKHWPGSAFIPVIDKQMAIMERLGQGQPAPDIAINTPDGKAMRLSDLRGKVVYLVFWAGWCKQCVGEMMSIKKSTALLKGKPLECVYVSLNTDSIADHNIAKKFKIEGLFTNVAGVWNAKEVQLYGIQSLPAYFLIDEDGNFALQNTPPPTQSTQLILDIEKLFK